MSESITPDEAIEEAIKVGAQGISLGLAKELQSERDSLTAEIARQAERMVLLEKVAEAAKDLASDHEIGDGVRDNCLFCKVRDALAELDASKGGRGDDGREDR